METYNKKIATNGKVELIHASMDDDKEAATVWAAKHHFPWPTVMKDELESSGLTKYSSGGIPDYVLIDTHGNKIAVGKAESFKKIKELTKK